MRDQWIEAPLVKKCQQRFAVENVPDYAFDCHTLKGKRKGKTKADFFREEQRALKPFQPGLFDDLPEN